MVRSWVMREAIDPWLICREPIPSTSDSLEMNKKGRKDSQKNARKAGHNRATRSNAQAEPVTQYRLPEDNRNVNEQRRVTEQGPDNDQGPRHDERPDNNHETLENNQDVLNSPTSGGTEQRREAPSVNASVNEVSDQEHPNEPPSENEVSDEEHLVELVRTRGANNGTDIPEEEDDRPTVITIGSRFPDTQVTSTISVILKSHFEGPWST